MIPEHEAAIGAWTERARLKNLAPATVRHDLGVIRRFLATLGERPLALATRDDVRGFLALSTGSRRALSAVRALFEAASPVDGEAPLPTDGLSVKPVPPRPQLVLTPDAVKRLLVVALDAQRRGRGFTRLRRAFALRDRALVELLYGLGLRASEARAARVTDLDVEGGRLLVRRAKRGESRFLPLPPSSLPHLRRYLERGRPRLLLPGVDDGGALFLNLRGRPLVQLDGVIAKLARLAGTRAHPHAFRRSVATHMTRDGVPITAVQALLGHASLSTTADYVSLDRDDLRRAVDTLEREPRGEDEGRASDSTA